jgi:biopolymer transport protein ExbD
MARFKPPDSEENVACNLIPMIDIMFLLLLFFMLGADMSQREIEDMRMPVAEQVKEDPKTDEGVKTMTINFLHADAPCAAYDGPTHLCNETEHWVVKIRGNPFTASMWKELGTFLTDFAREKPEEGNPGPRIISANKAMIRADQSTPYGQVQRLIQACSDAGLYKIEVGASKPLQPEK